MLKEWMEVAEVQEA